MIGADLEGADLESRVASLTASATSDDAAAVRAVIEAYGDWLAASDMADVVGRHTRKAAVTQPELETVVGTVKGDLAAVRARSQGRSRSALPARRNQRLSGSCSFRNAQDHWEITQCMHQPMPEQ